MNKDILIAETKKELISLKNLIAFKNLKNNLKFSNFSPEKYDECIYGQLYGHSEDERVKETGKKNYDVYGLFNGFNKIVEGGNLTALEASLLIMPKKTTEKIFSYLRGNLETMPEIKFFKGSHLNP